MLNWDSSIVENFLEIIWDLCDVFTVHICSARAQIQSLKSLWIVNFLRDDFEKLFNNDDKKCSKNSTVN